MQTIKNPAFIGFLGLTLAVAIIAPGTAAQAQTSQAFILISDNNFNSSYVTVLPGATVTWTNSGANQHSVVANDGSFDSGTLGTNQSFTRTFYTPGTYGYYDRFYGSPNSGMYGTVVVTGSNTTSYPVCTPSSQFANVGSAVTITATGGNGSYSWSAPNGSPTNGASSVFTTTFYVSGPQTVSVYSNGSTAQCTVNVSVNGNGNPTGSAPFCSPATQTANVHDFVSFSATGGNGTYYWLAGQGDTQTGSGSTFGTRFATAGTKTVILTSNGQSSLCSVQVNSVGQVLGVSDVSTGPENSALWAVVLGLMAAISSFAVILRKRLIK